MEISSFSKKLLTHNKKERNFALSSSLISLLLSSSTHPVLLLFVNLLFLSSTSFLSGIDCLQFVSKRGEKVSIMFVSVFHVMKWREDQKNQPLDQSYGESYFSSFCYFHYYYHSSCFSLLVSLYSFLVMFLRVNLNFQAWVSSCLL